MRLAWGEGVLCGEGGGVKREPDFIITREDGTPYLRRWWIIPRNPWFNIYLHHIQGDDDDRALHDHPWPNVSVVLKGGYWEVLPFTPLTPLPEGWTPPKLRAWRGPGSIVFRRPTAAHRLELGQAAEVIRNDNGTLKTLRAVKIPCWSLFITGPRVREWGFHCPKGWVWWKDFVDDHDTGRIGKGCGE